ncbi:MAG TPA: hypothetical protein VG294_06845 [Solirubrobacteraceae bacterium]|jgi:hypothetical protein|nr:hypothetical protein [Solirubrobacteraceae bacterium]
MRRRTLTAVAIGALILAAVAGTTALATRTVRIPSHVTIKSTDLIFTGRVTAANAACERARRVKLYRRTGSLLLGAATTNASGHWKITVAGFAGVSLGHFFARVRQRSEGTAGTIYVCKAAISPTIAFNQ